MIKLKYRRLDALAQVRLRLPGKFLASVATSEQVGFEHFGGGAEAETLAGRGIQARAELTEVLLGDLSQTLAGQRQKAMIGLRTDVGG